MIQLSHVHRFCGGLVWDCSRCRTYLFWIIISYFGLVVRKTVLGVSDKASFKPVSSATETCYKIQISLVASLHLILSK